MTYKITTKRKSKTRAFSSKNLNLTLFIFYRPTIPTIVQRKESMSAHSGSDLKSPLNSTRQAFIDSFGVCDFIEGQPSL